MCKGDLPALRKLFGIACGGYYKCLLCTLIFNNVRLQVVALVVPWRDSSSFDYLQVQNTIRTKLKPQSTILPEEPKVKNLLFILECNGNDSVKNTTNLNNRDLWKMTTNTSTTKHWKLWNRMAATVVTYNFILGSSRYKFNFFNMSISKNNWNLIWFGQKWNSRLTFCCFSKILF